jgi:hypothetical protein
MKCKDLIFSLSAIALGASCAVSPEPVQEGEETFTRLEMLAACQLECPDCRYGTCHFECPECRYGCLPSACKVVCDDKPCLW